MDLDIGWLVDLDTKAMAETDDVFTITGYASVFGNTDLGNDIVQKGAFAASLKKRDPLLLLNHKMDDVPIGTVVEVREDDRGLWFKGELPKEDALVKGRIIPQLKRKGLKGMSIGFKTKKKSMRNGTRVLEEVELYEISVVNMPMNPLAGVDSVKSDILGLNDWKSFTDREREAHLKAHGCSDELAKRFIRLDREDREAKNRRREAGEGADGLPDIGANIMSIVNR